MEESKQKEVVKQMNLVIFQVLNATNIGDEEMPLLGVKHALALSKAYKTQIVIIDDRCTGLECSWDSDSPFFWKIKDFQKLCRVKHPKMLRPHQQYVTSSPSCQMGYLLLTLDGL
jgi:hypothetical protein